MKFTNEIPLDDIRRGDHFDAEIACTREPYRPIWRRCEVVELCGANIVRVKTATRSDVIAITRDKIKSAFAWGMR
jgi:hypothetical protein